MENLIFEASGTNGQVQLFENKIVIKRKGLLASLSQGLMKADKEIYLKNISSIELKKNNIWTKGYIAFVFAGGNDKARALGNTASNENAVLFSKNAEEDFVKIKGLIEAKIHSPQATQPAASGGGIADLEKLADLKEKGIITDEEFQQKKRAILGL